MARKPTVHRPLRATVPAGHHPSAAGRGYGSRWQAYRKIFLWSHPICAQCGAPTLPHGHVDHIRAVNGGPEDPGFWDETNHQALCASCHSRKTAIHDGGFGNRKG